jgi:YD repeat-containing protein
MVGSKIRYLPGTPPGMVGGGPCVRTKNPPYNGDAYDNWGYYKADYVPSSNETFSRMTSYASNCATDVWSLRKITTSLGTDVTIDYEGNTYSKSVINKNNSIIVTSGEMTTDAATGNITNLTLNISNPTQIDLHSLLNNVINPVLDIRYQITTQTSNHTLDIILNSTENDNLENSGNDYSAITKKYAGFIVSSINSTGDQITLTPKDNTLYAVVYDAISHFIIPSAIMGFNNTMVAGNISMPNSGIHYGGGIRVKDIINDDYTGIARKTTYSYFTPNDPVGSSGVTSYEPTEFNNDPMVYDSDAQKHLYRRVLNKDVNYLMSIAREVPAPGVMYEYVTVSDSNVLPNGTEIGVPGSIMYQYEVFNSSMVGIKEYYHSTYNVNVTDALGKTTRNKIRAIMAIKDYASKVGNLKKIITYSSSGAKLTEVVNHYLGDEVDKLSFEDQVREYESQFADSVYNYQGVIQERYGNARFVAVAPDIYDDLFVMSGKETYPDIQTGVTKIDYKNGVTIDQKNLAYDYYSGKVIKMLTTDSYGNRFINEIIPAYKIYEYMGLRTHDGYLVNHYKQMLTQEASNKTYSVDINNHPIGIISANAQTWSNTISVLDVDDNVVEAPSQASVWRQQASYQWMPVGVTANNTTPYSSFVDYFSVGGSSNANWKKVQENTLYNVYSAALESTDINNQYSATHMGYNNSKVIITGGPAKYHELAYASVEDVLMTNGNFSTNVSPGSGTINTDTAYAHTGVKSLKVASGQQGFTYSVSHTDLSAKDYNVAVWVKPSSGTNINTAALFYQSNGGSIVNPSQTYSKSAAGWYLLEARIPASVIPTAGNLIVGCKNTGSSDLYFDDFRFQPYQSAVTAYVYDRHTGELTYVIDNNNLFTRYQYDDAGKLIRTYREVLGKTQIPLVSVNKYHYARSGGVSSGEFFPTMSIGQSVNTSPVAGFWAMDGAGNLPATTYLWNFGDGTTSTSQTGSHGYASPGLYTVTLTVTNPTYGSQVITKQLRLVTIELQEDPGGNTVVAVVNGIDLNTCQTFWVEKYCDYSPSMGPGCDMDFVPWVTYEDTYHPYNTYHEWTDSNETLEDFIAIDRFYFMITDGYGHTYQSDIFQ